LLRENCSVAVLDNFSPQVHGGIQELPCDLADHVELFRGDVRDRELLRRAVAKQDVVVHLAAETGTGQSMYEIARYQEINIGGTAALVDWLVNDKVAQVQKIVVASSRAIYGEGKHCCPQHDIVYPEGRASDQLRSGQYEPLCPMCRVPCAPKPTDESSPASPLSFYGLTKHVQEQMVLMFARTRGISAYGLRYQNVYGPGQSLSNPYTGILAIFSNLASAGSPIQVFEDGQESRDFIFVDDAVEATWRCIKADGVVVGSFNVGTGQRTTVLQVAKDIAQYFDTPSAISITGAFRHGDIRHNFADLTKVNGAIDFTPQYSFQQGLRIFLEWAAAQDRAQSQFALSLDELRERGLLHG
jgi:dTDP-L-rhamnose 4-epimerase